MRVRATKRERDECLDEVRLFIPGDGASVTVGKVYEVHAISVFGGNVLVQIVDDLRFPVWYPSVLFEVVNRDLPSDWQCNSFAQISMQKHIVVFGPEFVVQNEAAYNAMVELDADQVDLFWKRVDLLSPEGGS